VGVARGARGAPPTTHSPQLWARRGREAGSLALRGGV